MHRVFIAIPIGGKLQKEVKKFQKNYGHMPVRWLKMDDIHVTVIPPFEVKDIRPLKKKFLALKGNLKSSQICKEQNLKYRMAGFGPDPKHPHLIWVEGTAPDALSKLQKELAKALSLKLEPREFKLHTTLARFSASSYKDFPQKMIREKVDWTDSPGTLRLIESELLKSGVKYKTLAEIKL